MKKKLNRNRKSGPHGESVQAPEKRHLLKDAFDIPGTALAGVAHIEMADNREAIVDGCRGVVEYDETVIKLSTGKMVVKFSGRNLQIKVLTHDSAVVSGFISSMEFIT